MLNNLTNFFNLIDKKRLKTTPELSDLIALGTLDKKYTGRYKPTFISWDDLAQSVGDNLCDITLTPIEAILGPAVTYVNPNGGTAEDVIDTDLVISRADTGPPTSSVSIYNSALEAGFNDNGLFQSPLGTLWNIDGWGDLTDIETRTYDTIYNIVLGFGSYADILTADWVMYDQINNKYYKIKFTEFGEYPTSTAVSYTRELITLTTPCELTFSDGTKIDTAPTDVYVTAGTGIQVNETSGLGYRAYEIESLVSGSWDMPGVAFVDPAYNLGGVVGDGNQPFTTVAQANASGASLIYLKPGNHTLTVQSNKTYYAALGATASTVNDGGVTATNVKILGDLKVTAFYGLNFTGSGSNVYAEILEIDAVSASFIDNDTSLYLKVKKGINTTCANGGNYACRQYGGTLIIETPYFYSLQSLHSPRGAAPQFILRCPDIRILDGGTVPNGYKSPILLVGTLITADGAHFIIDLMGGTMRNLNSIASSTNAVPDSMLYNNYISPTFTTIFEVKNGTVYAGKMAGLYSENRFGVNVTLLYKNLDIISETTALSASSGTTSTGSVTIRIQDCNFESGSQMVLGYDVNIDFLRCNFKANGSSTEVFNFNTLGSSNVPTIYFKDSYFVFQTPGTSETFTGFAPATLGLLNSYSTEVIGVGAVDTWGGFTQVATLTLPNII